ncbi:MAG: methyltransferase domain-containing protein [Desulforhopalus sp.]
MTKRKAIHDRVLTASNKQELMQAYADWADVYDHDLIDEMGYVAPLIASSLLKENLESNFVNILDAGCGTGLVGACLHKFGFGSIDGLDYSPAMLKRAREKQIYRKLIEADLTAPLNISSNQYDAVICVGTFTCGHVGPEALYELVRVTRPKGHICFTVRDQAWEEDSYHKMIKNMEEKGMWKLLAETTKNYIEQEGSECKVCLYQVTKKKTD